MLPRVLTSSNVGAFAATSEAADAASVAKLLPARTTRRSLYGSLSGCVAAASSPARTAGVVVGRGASLLGLLRVC
jgi:hypothetical protein